MWKIINSKDEAKNLACKPVFFRVQDINYTKSGWYYIETYDQPCPRGCCRDNVIRIIPAETRVKEIQDEMKELSYSLKEARSYDS